MTCHTLLKNSSFNATLRTEMPLGRYSLETPGATGITQISRRHIELPGETKAIVEPTETGAEAVVRT